MAELTGMNRHTWVAGWVVLCAVGLAATTALDASSAADPQPGGPLSAECAEFIADIERQLAEAGQQGEEDRVLAFSRVHVGSEDDCRDDIRDHFRGDR